MSCEKRVDKILHELKEKVRRQIKRAKKEEEERDDLGFSSSDYYDMQWLKDREGISIAEFGNFDITNELIELINCRDKLIRKVAVNCFYFSNLNLLRRMAYGYLRSASGAHLISVVDGEDLLQQLYCDLLGGYLKLPQDTSKLSKIVFIAFKFAAVGGVEGVKVG